MKKTLNFLLLALLPWMGFAPVQPDAAFRPGKDYALFFAVNQYSDTGWQPLKNPVSDARAIARELEEMYGFATEVHENPDKKAILRVLEAWQQKRFPEDAQLLVFLSGHGAFSELQTKGFFVPKEGKASDPYNETHLDLTTIGNIVTKISCRHILLSIDACYSGTIDQEIAFRGKPAFGRPVPATGYDPRDPLIERQLRNKSRLLLTSGGKERTPDGQEHSPFAGAFLRGLRRAYTDGDGMLLFSDLLALMERVSPRPHQGALPGHEDGGFVFVPKALPVPASPRPETRPSTSVPTPKPVDLPGGPRMIHIPGGSFDMGDEFGDGGSDEKPVHRVTLSDFYLARTELSVADFAPFIKATGYQTDADKDGGSYSWTGQKWEKKAGVNWKCDAQGKVRPESEYNHPVIHVSWYDAVNYCNWLSKAHGYTPVYRISGTTVTANWQANGYRLPTEAEWEYAARSGGKKYKYAWGNGNPKGNIADETAKKQFSNWTIWTGYTDGHTYTAPVGSFEQGDLGLADMTGNVWEWCWDWYGTYPDGAQTNPRGPDTGAYRVRRGGSWSFTASLLRVASRDLGGPGYRYNFLGFRPARTP